MRRRRWEAEYRGGGRFVLRPHRRVVGGLVAVGFVVVVLAGALSRLRERMDAWLWRTAHTTVWTVTVAVVVGVALVWLWVRSGRR